MSFGVDEMTFSTSVWYDSSVDLYELDRVYGSHFMLKVYFPILAFKAATGLSLAPHEMEFRSNKHLATKEFVEFWKGWIHNGYGQWRFENNIDNVIPVINSDNSCDSLRPIHLENRSDGFINLAPVGGGREGLPLIGNSTFDIWVSILFSLLFVLNLWTGCAPTRSHRWSFRHSETTE